MTLKISQKKPESKSIKQCKRTQFDRLFFHKILQGGAKVALPKKIEYLHYGWRKRADFLTLIEACSNFISIKTCLERPFVNYIHRSNKHGRKRLF